MTKTQFSTIYAIGFYSGYVAKNWYMVFVGIGVFLLWEWTIKKIFKNYKIESINHA